MVNADKTVPSKINPFIAVRPKKEDHFSKTPNQDDNKYKKPSSNSDKKTNKDQNKNKKIYILRCSMIKNLKVWEISKKLKNANVYVKHFAGAKVRCRKDHIKPTLREKPDHIVLHVGTNDLVSDWPPDLIVKSIVDVPSSMKNENHDVTVSNIITRADHFREKANKVNDYLLKLCIERNIYLIDHIKTLKTKHLNGSKLHLNRRGAPILQKPLQKFLSKIFNWYSEENNAEMATVSSTSAQPDKECNKSKASQTANMENTNMDLKALHLKNFKKLIIAHLNTNSLRNKFEFLIFLIKDKVDVLMVSETKLDQSFSTNHYMIKVLLSILTEMIKVVVLFYILEKIYHHG